MIYCRFVLFFVLTVSVAQANFFDFLGKIAEGFGYHPERRNYTNVPNTSYTVVECRAPNPDYDNRIKAADDAIAQAQKMPGAPASPLNADPKQAYKDYLNYKNALSDISDMFKDANRVVTIKGNICKGDDSSLDAQKNSCQVITSQDGSQEQWIPRACQEQLPADNEVQE